MDRQEIFEKIKAIADEIGANTTDMTFNSSFEEDLGMDSLDQIELLMGLEKEFKREIPDEGDLEIKRVSDLVNYIEDKI